MAVVRYKIPSQAASGAETFSDNLVGNQITDGSSQLTNTNFDIERVIPEKDSKDFKSEPFTDFVTLKDIKEETNGVSTLSGSATKKEKIKFRGSINDAGKSLFGSLKERLGVSVTDIIEKFPAAMLVDKDSPIKSRPFTLTGITYNTTIDTTEFTIQKSTIYNPFDITIETPYSNTIPTTNNHIRNFYSSYKNYVVVYGGSTYDVISYTEPDANNLIKLKVKGKPFTGTSLNENILIRPNDGITEEFFNGLDDLESLLLNRDTNPVYQASFKVPRESLDETRTEIINIYINWPTTKDGWNLQINGIDYADYIGQLSSIGEEIDDYKSNLIVRFLTAPQLFEFDTNDQKAQSIFQLYGQSFDRIKKYIDNIAYMRNVSYDGINNVPDALLKNLSETLGLSTVNLFDEKSVHDILYKRQANSYSGLTQGLNLIEAEYEFYRRLLVNLVHLYKSKGTRSAIEFFLKFLGAPEPMIKIEEYVYNVTSLPNEPNFETDLYKVIQGVKVDTVITGVTSGVSGYTYYTGTTSTSTTGYTYLTGSIKGSSTLSRDEYPIDEFGLPRKTTNLSSDIYFQKGSGWNDLTLDHRSSNVIDTELSSGSFVNGVFQLTGRTKTIKTKPKDYTYGEEYFDNFRKLSGLDYGFGLESTLDNKKISVVSDDSSKLILNRKNIGIYLSPSQTIEYDIYRKSRNLNLTFGTLSPQTNVTFEEFSSNVLGELITNSHVTRIGKSYQPLEKTYNAYITNSGFTSYNFATVNEFINKMSPSWIKVIEQFVPATTLWSGGNLIENNVFNRSKYDYRKPRYGVIITGSTTYEDTSFNCEEIEPLIPS